MGIRWPFDRWAKRNQYSRFLENKKTARRGVPPLRACLVPEQHGKALAAGGQSGNGQPQDKKSCGLTPAGGR